MEPKYPQIFVKLAGEDGNAFSIIGRVADALRKANVPIEERVKFRDEAMGGDYDHVIQTALAWVSEGEEPELDMDETERDDYEEDEDYEDDNDDDD